MQNLNEGIKTPIVKQLKYWKNEKWQQHSCGQKLHYSIWPEVHFHYVFRAVDDDFSKLYLLCTELDGHSFVLNYMLLDALHYFVCTACLLICRKYLTRQSLFMNKCCGEQYWQLLFYHFLFGFLFSLGEDNE